jgi:hypothetical protein
MDIKNIQSVASVLGMQCASSGNTVKSENKSLSSTPGCVRISRAKATAKDLRIQRMGSVDKDRSPSEVRHLRRRKDASHRGADTEYPAEVTHLLVSTLYTTERS